MVDIITVPASSGPASSSASSTVSSGAATKLSIPASASGTSQIIVIPQSLLQQTVLGGKAGNNGTKKQQVIKISPAGVTTATMNNNINIATAAAKKRPLAVATTTNTTASIKKESDCDSPPPRKRANLDHLTPEEKLMRRKLKNRVAAQNARDKKRAKMEDMDVTIFDLKDQVRRLQEENKRLEAVSNRLLSENQALRLGHGIKEEMPLSPASSIPSPRSESSMSSSSSSTHDQTIVVPRPSAPAEHTQNGLLQQDQGRRPAVEALAMATCLFWTCMAKATSAEEETPPAITTASAEEAASTEETISQQQREIRSASVPLKKRWWGPQQRSWAPAKD